MTTNAPIEDHGIHSQRMLAHAREQLAAGDRVQAAEKIWGAAAHKLAEIANQRGWPLTSHRDNADIAEYIAALVGDLAIVGGFDSAAAAHQNFYADLLPIHKLEARLNAVSDLIERLETARHQLPLDLDPPTDTDYRLRHPDLLDPGTQRELNLATQELAAARRRISDPHRRIAEIRKAAARLAAAAEDERTPD